MSQLNCDVMLENAKRFSVNPSRRQNFTSFSVCTLAHSIILTFYGASEMLFWFFSPLRTVLRFQQLQTVKSSFYWKLLPSPKNGAVNLHNPNFSNKVDILVASFDLNVGKSGRVDSRSNLLKISERIPACLSHSFPD